MAAMTHALQPFIGRYVSIWWSHDCVRCASAADCFDARIQLSNLLAPVAACGKSLGAHIENSRKRKIAKEMMRPPIADVHADGGHMLQEPAGHSFQAGAIIERSCQLVCGWAMQCRIISQMPASRHPQMVGQTNAAMK